MPISEADTRTKLIALALRAHYWNLSMTPNNFREKANLRLAGRGHHQL